jgi:hypothetical protein
MRRRMLVMLSPVMVVVLRKALIIRAMIASSPTAGCVRTGGGALDSRVQARNAFIYQPGTEILLP